MAHEQSRSPARRAARQGCYVYVLLASDGSLYTGIALDPARRLTEHNSSRRGAKALRGKRPLRLLRCWLCESRSAALKLEAAIKRLRAVEKWSLVLSNGSEPEGICAAGCWPHDPAAAL